MLASSLSSVLLPDPLRPTMPKNSPWRISKETPSSACSWRKSREEKGRTMRSFSESTLWVGMRKDFSRSRTSIATGAWLRSRAAVEEDRAALLAFWGGIGGGKR